LAYLHIKWVETDVCGLLANNLGPLSLNVGSECGILSFIVSRKKRCLQVLRFIFASRYIYLFKSRKNEDQSGWKIKPAKYINRKIIEECWDDILRLLVTIKQKETTASDIFRRLNSYSKQHRLYQGLKAFGQIIKSQFILRYLDDVELRQAIESQLNKVELANRFTRAVAVGNPREFTQGDKEEQEIVEACN